MLLQWPVYCLYQRHDQRWRLWGQALPEVSQSCCLCSLPRLAHWRAEHCWHSQEGAHAETPWWSLPHCSPHNTAVKVRIPQTVQQVYYKHNYYHIDTCFAMYYLKIYVNYYWMNFKQYICGKFCITVITIKKKKTVSLSTPEPLF